MNGTKKILSVDFNPQSFAVGGHSATEFINTTMFLGASEEAWVSAHALPEGRYTLYCELIQNDILNPTLTIHLKNVDVENRSWVIEGTLILDIYELIAPLQDDNPQADPQAQETMRNFVVTFLSGLFKNKIKGNDTFWLNFGKALSTVAAPAYEQACEASQNDNSKERDLKVTYRKPPTLN